MGRVLQILANLFAMWSIFLATPTSALDINSFRAQHHLPRLAASATLAGLA